MRASNPGYWLVAGSILFFVSAYVGWAYLPKDTRLLFGDPAPVVPAAISIGSFLALCVGGLLAYLSYAASRMTEVAQRFQKAIELVSDSSETAAIGGLCILHEVAIEHHRRYLYPYATVVESHIYQNGYDQVRRVLEAPDPESVEWPRTRRSAVKALEWLARVPRKLRWWGTDEHIVFGLYLHEMTIAQCDFSRISIHYSLANRVRFVDCTFANCRLKLNVFDQVQFTRCNFVDCSVELYPVRKGQDPFEVVGFDACRLKNARINLEPRPDGAFTFGRPFPVASPAFQPSSPAA